MGEELHDLTAAYALDALDDAERAAYEEHLAGCEECREQVALFAGVTSELAFAAGPAEPPPALRDRILVAATAERPNVVPLRPRWARPAAVVAAVAACVAVGLGVWNISLHHQLSNAHTTQALQTVPVKGMNGSLVVSSTGSAALVAYTMPAAPSGKTYEAWVLRGGKAIPAGTFDGGPGSHFIPIEGKVPAGSKVAVTVEPAGGSPQPTSTPFAVSSAV
jgi:anti-sigma-K factor RskA